MPISKTMKQVTATKESEEKNDETAITGAAAKEETANVEMVERNTTATFHSPWTTQISTSLTEPALAIKFKVVPTVSRL